MPKKEYPTRSEIQEFLEAHQKGGKHAILELLRRKRAEVKQDTPASTPPESVS
jgi:hypothetical protein